MNYFGEGQAYTEWTGLANVAGFDDPVVAGFLTLMALCFIASIPSQKCPEKKTEHNSQIRDDDYEYVENYRDSTFQQKAFMCGAAATGLFLMYALVAGSVSVMEGHALSSNFIDTDNTSLEKGLYFGVASTLLVILVAGIIRNHLTRATAVMNKQQFNTGIDAADATGALLNKNSNNNQ